MCKELTNKELLDVSWELTKSLNSGDSNPYENRPVLEHSCEFATVWIIQVTDRNTGERREELDFPMVRANSSGIRYLVNGLTQHSIHSKSPGFIK